MFHSYVSGVENAPLPSCIPEENAPAPSCIRTQCCSRGMRYKKSGRHYSCMGRVSWEGQCDMLAWMKNRMRNALNMHRESIATCQLTLSPGYHVPLLRLRSRECSTAVLLPEENAQPPSCIPVENAPPPSCIPEENAPPPSLIRTQRWRRGMRYKKSGRHYSCMGRVSRERQCWPELNMECETHWTCIGKG